MKTIFIEEAGAIPYSFSTTSEFNLIDQAKRPYGYFPILSGVITDTGTFQNQNNNEDLSPQLAHRVEGHGRSFITVAFVDNEQIFITRIG
ncbi:cytosolic protein [Vibrio crassostreae]|uniref:cytosolic protein n=1 Tax=Vibrio crassostreae TaxID=246167 RepID=UPI0009BAF4F1|nr:cytosolic protein [Vibrio crassostreae]